ncbi:MAG: hypothetical protein JHC31_12645 [Sulfurihydrogenibium sp.]|nr:hypothetical protein [Sulfurihydrogenibium sp.]
MRTVILRKNGKKIDMFKMTKVMKSIRVFRALNEVEDDEIEYHVMYLSFKVNNKYVYLMLVEPYIFSFDAVKTNKFAVAGIKELDVEVLVESDMPELVKYSYYISDELIEDEIMIHHLFGSLLDPDDYTLEEESDCVFLECE